MNLTSFRTEIAGRLGLSVSDSAELALIDQWVNEGVAYVVRKGQTRVSTGTVSVTAGTGDYDLASSVMRILWLATSTAALDPAGVDEILRRRLDGSSTSTTSPLLYAVDGANQLLLYPAPAETGSLTLRYVPAPASLTGGNNTPSEIPAEFHRLVTLYALWQGGDYDDDRTSSQGLNYKALLDEGLRDLRKSLVRKKGRRLPRASVTKRRGRLQFRNDADI